MSSKSEIFNFPFAIVSFGKSKNKGLIDVELVPRSWIFWAQNTWKCRYPPEEEYHLCENWIKEMKEAETTWKAYDIDLVASAVDYKQGQRRLKRSYSSRDVISTDPENNNKNIQPTILSESGIHENLRQELPMYPVTLKGKNTKGSGKQSRPQNVHRSLSQCSANDKENLLSSKKLSKWRKIRVNQSFSDSSTDEITQSNTTLSPHQDQTKQKDESDSLSEENQETSLQDNDFLIRYIDKKFETMHKLIVNSKRSILYDLEKKLSELKLTIDAVSTNSLSKPINELLKMLGTNIPIDDMDDFLGFEKDLADVPEKRETLLELFKIWCIGLSTSKECIAKVLPKMIKKSVQGQYSGKGRNANGSKKENFSATETFQCLREVIFNKFGDTEESQKLESKVGYWLTHFKDREGGRKER